MSHADLRPLAKGFAEEIGTADPDAFVASALEASGGGLSADQFLVELRAVLSRDSDLADLAARGEHDALLHDLGRDLYGRLKPGGVIETAETAGLDIRPAPGSAAGFDSVKRRLLSLQSGGAAAIARVLNQATYFTMKARAGKVGRSLAVELANRVPQGIRIHLVGHSFGGRLVTAAAAEDQCPPLESLSLLQAAYSHNGLGTGFGDGHRIVGAFRAVIERAAVGGPILVTHTLNDRAVGLAYALASATTGTIASGLGISSLIGGPDDPHGGMGANGARSLKSGEAVAWQASVTSMPTLRRGMVNNVLSDAIVSDHNDVENEPVGSLVWAAMSAR